MSKHHHFTSKKQSGYFNAFKFKDQDEKAPKLGILSEDVMSYYRQVTATLENGFDDDDPSMKGEFLNNVYLTLKDEGIQVSQNQTVSRILEVLFTHSSPTHLQGLLVQFCKELAIVSFDRFASHVFEALIQFLPMMYDDEGDTEERSQLKASLDHVCQFTESHLIDFMTHTYGSHVLRSLLEVLGGVLVKDEVKQSRVSRKQNLEKKPVVSRALSQDYNTWFAALKDKIIRLCNYEDHLIDINYCPVLQTVLLILHKVSPSEYAELASTIISKSCPPIVIDSAKEDVAKRLPMLVQSEVGSYLMELIISLASESQIKDLYNDVFKEKVIYFSVHPIANYVLQKLLTCVTDKDTFLELIDETIKYLEDVLAVNHVGIVTKLVEACKNRHLGQEKICQALRSAFHCDDPKEKQLKVVPLIASMQTYDVMYPPPEKQKKNSGILNSVIIHGSLILQQLLHFDNTKLIVSSLLELSPAELAFLCCDKSGSHVVDAFFQSPGIKEKSKEDFLKKLQGMYVNVACNRNGSRCLESIWKDSSVKRRTFIAEELLKSQERIESDQWGHFLYKNFALFKFSHRRKEWIDFQNGIFKKQQLLQNILEGNTDKRKKNKKGKNSHQTQDELPDTSHSKTELIEPGVEEETSDVIENPKHSKNKKAAEMTQTSEFADINLSVKKKKKKKSHLTTELIEPGVEKETSDVTVNPKHSKKRKVAEIAQTTEEADINLSRKKKKKKK